MSRDQILRAFTKHFQELHGDEYGAIISSELALVGTLGVLGMAVGIESAATAVNQELNDFGNAISSLDQSFSVRSLSKLGHSRVAGTCFNSRSNAFNSNSQLTLSDVCGTGTPGLGGGLSDVSSISIAPIVSGVQEREAVAVRALEDCSTTPVTIQETRVPKTTTVTVSITDSDAVSQTVSSATVRSRCVKEPEEHVIEERIIKPDVRDSDSNLRTKPKAAQPVAPREKPEAIPMPKAAPSKPTTPKAAPSNPATKATPKTQIPKPQAKTGADED